MVEWQKNEGKVSVDKPGAHKTRLTCCLEACPQRIGSASVAMPGILFGSSSLFLTPAHSSNKAA